MEPSKIIDEIYEAAIIPQFWTRTLDRMAQIAGGEGTLLFAAGQKDPQILSSPAIEQFVQMWISEGWISRDERGGRLIPIAEPRFLTDLDAFTIEELDDITIYRDFFWKIGFGWCAGTTINSPTGDTVVFSIERRFKLGPVEKDAVAALDVLRRNFMKNGLLLSRNKWDNKLILSGRDGESRLNRR